MQPTYLAVLDIGKTNKKIVVYDEALTMVQSQSEVFDDIVENGLSFEPIEAITAWFFQQLNVLSSQYNIGVVSVSTHGAAFVCTDANGEITVPVLSYTSDPGEAFHARFHQTFGSADELHLQTGTPSMPGLGCMGKAIYFIQGTYPEAYAKTTTLLNFPQYFGFLLTGRKSIERTYAGNHTYLWDFKSNDYSPMVDRLAIRHLLPDTLSAPWDILGTVNETAAQKSGLSTQTIVTVGIHDSNAALLPYLIKEKTSFVLNSSGSVMVNMRCETEIRLEEKDLGKVILYNTSAFSDPVRTSIFLGGLEFDVYHQQIQSRHPNKTPLPFNQGLAERILTQQQCFIIPSVIPFGIFPHSSPKLLENGTVFSFNDAMAGRLPGFFDDFETAYTVLSLSLAIQTKVAMEEVGVKDGDVIYIEGGFSKNDTYLALLSAMFKNSPLMLSNLEEATSFGTALVGLSALRKTHPRELSHDFRLDCREIEKPQLEGLDGYLQTFLSVVNE